VAAVVWTDQGHEPGIDVLATVVVGDDDSPELGGATHGSSVTVSARTA
jgi:hypothetical protein